MVAGIEAAGLALAVLPVIVDIIDRYEGCISGRDTEFLADTLKNHERIFLNSVETLLRSIVSASELRILLDDPEGQSWRHQSLTDKVVERLGSEASGILEKANSIYGTVLALKRKLPAPDADVNKNQIARAKKVIKSFVYGPRNKASLEKLKSRIHEFRILTEDVLNLGPARRKLPRALQDLELIQECAAGLYDALRGGWHCECDRFHPANIELEVWSPEPKDAGDTLRLKFSFLFADNAQQAMSDHWMTAEITPFKKASGEDTQGEQHNSSSASSHHSTSPTQQAMPQNSEPSSLPRTISHQCQENRCNTDLCAMLTNQHPVDLQPVPRKLISISDGNGHEYRLSTRFDESTTVPIRQSIKLAEALGKSVSSRHGSTLSFRQSSTFPMSNKDRVQLGLVLAWGVLQISSTNWLGGYWTVDNILLVIDPPNKPHPYVSHWFQSSRRNSTTSSLAPSESEQIMLWIQNAALFALARLLIELCYDSSIEDLADESELTSGESQAFTPLLTVTRLSKVVQDELGLKYAHAVKSCISPDFEMDKRGRPKDTSEFARSMMKNVIEPLESVMESFGK